jgi:LysR family transcriptional activator of glutamate synthase operon
MEFREVRSLVLLAEMASIRAVAEAVHLSSPSVHKHLKSLEAEFGVQLYERDGRRLKLTAAAESIISYLQTIVADYDTAVRVLDEWKGVRRGLVQIGAGQIVGTYLIPGILEKFLARNPGINATIRTGPVRFLIEQLNSGAVDVAFIAVQELDDEQRTALDSLDVVCEVVDLAMALVSGTPMGRRRYSLTELQHVPFVRYDKELGINRVVQRYFAEAGFRPHAVVHCDYTETMKVMVQKVKGLSLLPLWAVKDEIRAGTLWLVRQSEPPLHLKIILATRKGRYAPPAVRALIDLIRQHKPSDDETASRAGSNETPRTSIHRTRKAGGDRKRHDKD